MSSKVVIYCDECGIEKGETNNWKSISGTRSVPRFYTYHEADNDVPRGNWRLDFCGQQCITTVFQRWLDTGDVDKVPPAPLEVDWESAEREAARISEQKENNRREEERINRPA